MANTLPKNFAAAHFTASYDNKKKQNYSSSQVAPQTSFQSDPVTRSSWTSSVNSIVRDASNGASREELSGRIKSVVNSSNTILQSIRDDDNVNDKGAYRQSVYDTAMKLRDYYIGNTDELPTFYDYADNGKQNNAAQNWIAQANALIESMKYGKGDYTQDVQALLDTAKSSYSDAKKSAGYLWPVDGGAITSGFGYRKAPIAGASTNHQAIDIGAAEGTPIYAAADGVVSFSGDNGGYGNTVKIGNDDGLTMRYSHMASYTVRSGERVKRGDVIGYVGQTGTATGPHLDFGVYDSNGNAINPETLAYGGSEEENQKLHDEMQETIDALYASYNQHKTEQAHEIAQSKLPASIWSTEKKEEPEVKERSEYATEDKTNIFHRLGLSGKSGAKSFAGRFMDYAAFGTENENRIGNEITQMALDNYVKAQESYKNIVNAYENGGVWQDGTPIDKADYEDAKDQIEHLQFYIDAFSTANAENQTISAKAGAEADKVNESAAEDMEKATDGLGWLGTQLVRGAGNAVDNTLSLAVGGGASALPAMAVGTYGQEARNAEKNGDDREKAAAIGIARSVAEIGPEIISGGNPITGPKKGVIDEFLDNVKSSKILNNIFVRTGLDLGAEGVEEVVTQALNDAISKIAYGKDAETATVNDYVDAFVGGVIGALYGKAEQAAVNPRGTIKSVRDAFGTEQRTVAEQEQWAATITPTEETAVTEPLNAQNEAQTQQTEPTLEQRRESLAEREAQLTQKAQELSRPDVTQEEITAFNQEAEAVKAERENIRQAEFNEVQTDRVNSGKVSANFGQAENHIDNRNMSDMGDTRVKAFQWDHPELHDFYVEAATDLAHDAGISSDTEYNGKGKNRRAGDTTPQLDRARGLGLSRNQIIDVCQRIIDDHGQENTADAKRVEIILDDMLTNGYQSIEQRTDGTRADANAAYIEAKSKITGAETAEDKYVRDNGMRAALEGLSDDELREEYRRSQTDGLGAADYGFDPVSEWQNNAQPDERGRLYHPVNEDAAQDTMNERGRTPVDMPVLDENGGHTSKHASTIANAKLTTNEVSAAVMEAARRGDMSYIQISDADAQAKAAATIKDKGWDMALAEFNADVNRGVVSKELYTLGLTLFNNAANSGDVLTAIDIATQLSKMSPRAAQTLQAMSMVNKLSPQLQLYAAVRSVENLREDLIKKYGDRAPDLDLSDDLLNNYRDAIISGDEAAIKDAWNAITKSIAQQVPSTFSDRFNAWRYLSMLGNARTHARNIFGNMAFAPMRGLKNLAATGGEVIVDKLSGGKTGRTKSVINFLNEKDRALVSSAWSLFQEDENLVQSGGKYTDSANEIDAQRTIFKFKPLEKLRKLNSLGLDKEDVLFSRPAYTMALAGYLKANSITAESIADGTADADILAAARKYAIKESAEATYRDTNAFSDAITKLGYKGSTNKVQKAANVALSSVLPFKRTPANVLVRGIEYSPIGMITNTSRAFAKVKSGEWTANQAINEISKGISGTAALALGAYLASVGKLVGKLGDNDEEEQFLKLQGYQDYSLQLGDTSYTLDWAAPTAMEMFVGANIYDWWMSENKSIDGLMDAIAKVTDPMLEMSALSGVSDIIDDLSYAKDEGNVFFGTLAALVRNYLSQFVPTLGGQIERSFFEDEREQTYRYDDNSPINKNVRYWLGSVMNKTPGEYSQIPYINAWGERESSGTLGASIFENFLSPGYISKVDTNKVEAELQRIYDDNPDISGIFPTAAAQSTTVNGKHFTKDEYVKYAEARGQKQYSLVSDFMESGYYDALNDEARAEVIKSIYSFSDSYGKHQAAKDYDNSTWSKLWSASNKDIIGALTTKGITSGTENALEASEAIINSDLSDRQKIDALYSNSNTDGRAKYYESAFDAGISLEEVDSFYGKLKDMGKDTGSQSAVKEAALATMSEEDARELYQIYSNARSEPWKTPFDEVKID